MASAVARPGMPRVKVALVLDLKHLGSQRCVEALPDPFDTVITHSRDLLAGVVSG